MYGRHDVTLRRQAVCLSRVVRQAEYFDSLWQRSVVAAVALLGVYRHDWEHLADDGIEVLWVVVD